MCVKIDIISRYIQCKRGNSILEQSISDGEHKEWITQSMN